MAESLQSLILCSCDTFVALPPATKDGLIIFGKNSDRPGDEVQEVVYQESAQHKPADVLKCTYIEIPQVERTHAVVLSKPGWMWGAEMGANEHGVVIGNEAVWSKLTGTESGEGLIGMDYVRLGLERGSTAHEAVEVITTLLAEHGQRGRCFEHEDWAGVAYDNSFIVADRTEAWVLETAGRLWAAQQIKEGVRNISNMLTIHSDITLMSPALVERATEMGFYNTATEGAFDFSKVFAVDAPVKRPLRGTAQYRFTEGRKLLEIHSTEGQFTVESMFNVLRNKEAGICCTGPSVSVASQVSVLSPPTSSLPHSIHWFTATPNPAHSIFKPFSFTDGASIGPLTRCPDYGDHDPRILLPRFKTQVNRQHPLYAAHARIRPVEGEPKPEVLKNMRVLEKELLYAVQSHFRSHESSGSDIPKLKDLFQSAVEREIKLY